MNSAPRSVIYYAALVCPRAPGTGLGMEQLVSECRLNGGGLGSLSGMQRTGNGLERNGARCVLVLQSSVAGLAALIVGGPLPDPQR